ncbi:hypothetical protein [Haloarcula argentinensis]|uniref:Uncharacterized protein n=1 Tax=Haloarcula argentinensis TaxID=43776 RepID=A0A847UP50_HALAR|nr:hypothetical protein [Haloarcula argentinensis]NLV14376.1 hypothetical protein [Haloarcula argentinensis]
MSNCTAEAREKVRRAARTLAVTHETAAVDVLPPSESQYDRWTLDAALCDTAGIPPAVLRELALVGLTLRPKPSQADAEIVVATA